MNRKPNEETLQVNGRQEAMRSHLRTLRFRGNVVAWSATGIVSAGLGMLGLTGLSTSPLLFLLYPVLIFILALSLCALALNLLHRL